MKPQLSFESLTSAYLDGTISAEELVSLEEILLHDPEARKSFRQIANLDSALRDWAPICAAQAAWADAAPQSVQSRRSRWQTWSAAAALVFAGILTGFISGTMVSGRSLTAREARSIELPLKNHNFDGPERPQLDGCPKVFGIWGGDFSVVTESENEIQPPEGKSMLRFLRADNRTTAPNVGTVSSEQWQVVDLRPMKKAFEGHSAKIEFSALFNSIPAPSGHNYAFGISFYAFNGEAKDAEYLWAHRKELCLAGMEKDELNDNDPESWQKLAAQIVSPPDADLVLVQVRVCPRPMPKGIKSAFEFPGQYVANTSLRLIPE